MGYFILVEACEDRRQREALDLELGDRDAAAEQQQRVMALTRTQARGGRRRDR